MKNVEDLYVLSSLQKRMLLHALAAPHGNLLSQQLTCSFQGELDVNAMKRAWETVIRRHPALRTAFAWEGLKKPLQVVRRQVRLPWEQHDLRGLGPEASESRRTELLQENRTRPFQLDRAPLMRLALLQRTGQTYDFAWTCHHLVTDGWCLALVLAEVLTSYEAYRQGRAPRPDPAPTFRDYIAWLDQQDPAAGQRFWQEYLAECPAPVHLAIQEPGDGTPARAESFQQTETALSAQATRQLAELAATRHVSTSTLLEAAWALLLARYSGQNDVIYGTTVSGRPPDLPGVESIVGPLINNLPVRVRLNPHEPILPWLGRLHTAKMELQAYAYCPLEEIHEASSAAPGRRLFDTLVVVENYPLRPKRLAQLTSLRILDAGGTATANYPLTLVAEPGQRLALRLRYDSRQFHPTDATRLLDHLVTLLVEMAANPHRRLADLPLEAEPSWFPFEPARIVNCFISGAGECSKTEARCASEGRTSNGFSREARGGCPPALKQYCPGGTEHDRPEPRPALVLDPWGQPAPVGVPGELALGEPGATGPRAGPAAEGPRPAATDGQGDGDPWANWLRTGARVRRLADGRIEYLGQMSDPLAVGVYRVDPERVRSQLLEHPLVQDAAVVGWRHPTGFQWLAAYVVPAREAASLLDGQERALVTDRLRRWLRERLPEAVAPRALLAVDSLPRSADGQLDTAALPPPAQPRPEAMGPPVAPRDPIEAQLATIWSELLGVYPVGVTDPFMDLGGDSTQAVSLISRIEDQFQRKLPLVALFHEPTVEYLAGLLRRPAASAEEQTLVPIQPRGRRRPLFCVHPAGGTVFCYLELARSLPQDQPVYGLQAQGIDGLLAPHTSVEAMAQHYVQAIRRHQEHGPYLVCGWSSGGIIAFEVARQIEAQGREVAMLALFDAGAPDPDQPLDGTDLLPLLAMMFPGESEEALQQLEKASPEEQLAYFQQRAEVAQLVVTGAAASQARNVYQVFQANMEAITQYRPRPCAAPITLFRAEQPSTPMHRDPWLGWRRWAQGGIQVHRVPGNHLTMFRPPTIRRLANQLRHHLAEAQARHGEPARSRRG